jgi:hypothetical protein
MLPRPARTARMPTARVPIRLAQISGVMRLSLVLLSTHLGIVRVIGGRNIPDYHWAPSIRPAGRIRSPRLHSVRPPRVVAHLPGFDNAGSFMEASRLKSHPCFPAMSRGEPKPGMC